MDLPAFLLSCREMQLLAKAVANSMSQNVTALQHPPSPLSCGCRLGACLRA